ncbi:hypothetical protein AGLY_001660 [Aphis glycines]|uniref:Uncharacterized protein n=1 Tax=Aphis glycines TaxID=307491 RepID=A0A6G0U4C2_APHGL|nr:hypothetical protein AGLY_001660 [Aphis glycines]
MKHAIGFFRVKLYFKIKKTRQHYYFVLSYYYRHAVVHVMSKFKTSSADKLCLTHDIMPSGICRLLHCDQNHNQKFIVYTKNYILNFSNNFLDLILSSKNERIKKKVDRFYIEHIMMSLWADGQVGNALLYSLYQVDLGHGLEYYGIMFSKYAPTLVNVERLFSNLKKDIVNEVTNNESLQLKFSMFPKYKQMLENFPSQLDCHFLYRISFSKYLAYFKEFEICIRFCLESKTIRIQPGGGPDPPLDHAILLKSFHQNVLIIIIIRVEREQKNNI